MAVGSGPIPGFAFTLGGSQGIRWKAPDLGGGFDSDSARRCQTLSEEGNGNLISHVRAGMSGAATGLPAVTCPQADNLRLRRARPIGGEAGGTRSEGGSSGLSPLFLSLYLPVSLSISVSHSLSISYSRRKFGPPSAGDFDISTVWRHTFSLLAFPLSFSLFTLPSIQTPSLYLSHPTPSLSFSISLSVSLSIPLSISPLIHPLSSLSISILSLSLYFYPTLLNISLLLSTSSLSLYIHIFLSNTVEYLPPSSVYFLSLSIYRYISI